MQDEHFMRQWNAGHVRFSGDLDRALYKAAGGVLRRLGNRHPIDRTYNEGRETPLARKARLARNAVIGGITIGVGLALTPLGLAAVLPPETAYAVSTACVQMPAIA